MKSYANTRGGVREKCTCEIRYQQFICHASRLSTPGDAETTELPPNGNYSAPGVSVCRVGGRAPGSVGNKSTPAVR